MAVKQVRSTFLTELNITMPAQPRNRFERLLLKLAHTGDARLNLVTIQFPYFLGLAVLLLLSTRMSLMISLPLSCGLVFLAYKRSCRFQQTLGKLRPDERISQAFWRHVAFDSLTLMIGLVCLEVLLRLVGR